MIDVQVPCRLRGTGGGVCGVGADVAPRRRPGHALCGGDVFVHECGVFECGLCQHHVHLELGVQTLHHRVWVVWGVFGPTLVLVSKPLRGRGRRISTAGAGGTQTLEPTVAEPTDPHRRPRVCLPRHLRQRLFVGVDLRIGVFPIVSAAPMVSVARLCPVLAVLPWPELHPQTKVRRIDRGWPCNALAPLGFTCSC